MSDNALIPSFLHHLFWSYDIRRLDRQRDQRLVITQILNRGSSQAVRWLKKTYSDQEICEVLQSPGRGLWFPQVLNFWLIIYGIRLTKEKTARASFSLIPRNSLT